MWLRLIPIVDPGKTWSAEELKECVFDGTSFNLAPFFWADSLPSLRAEDGYGTYHSVNRSSEAEAVAFAFETGEIWSIDTTILRFSNTIEFHEIKKIYTERLSNYARFLSRLGIVPPYRWVAGLEEVKDRSLMTLPSQHFSFPSHSICLADVIMQEGTYSPDEAPEESLRPFFELIFRKCGKSYSATLPIVGT